MLRAVSSVVDRRASDYRRAGAEAGPGGWATRLGQRARALWMGLCEAAGVRLAAGGLELARL
eukprot:scaffold116448_cov98-Phaeocystis_antarctica.AAC.1